MSERADANAASGHPRRRIALGLALALALALSSARAQAPAPPQGVDDIAALRAELVQIASLTRDVDARLRALEAKRDLSAASDTVPQPAAMPVPAAVATPMPMPMHMPPPLQAAVPAPAPGPAWRQLHEGMTSDEVTALIGTPTRVFQLSGKTVWYYRYPAAELGSVFFTAAGRISSVQRP